MFQMRSPTSASFSIDQSPSQAAAICGCTSASPPGEARENADAGGIEDAGCILECLHKLGLAFGDPAVSDLTGIPSTSEATV